MGSDVHSLVPARIQIAINNSCLSQTFLVFIAKDNVRVTEAVDIASFEVLGFDDFDREDIVIYLALSLTYRESVSLYNFNACINIDLPLELVKLLSGELDII